MLRNKFTYISDMLILILGCFIMAVGLNTFLEPYTIASGGLTGLAIVLNKIFSVKLWIINLLFNIPLLVFGFKILGKKNSFKTLEGILFLTLFLGLTEPLTRMLVTEDILLSAIAGGIVIGISLGLLFRINASTGGTELACLILNKIFPFISISTFMFIIDGIVILLAGFVTRNIETALYATASLYITVKVSDVIVEGFDFSKAALIISDTPKDLSKNIMNELGRGITFLEGRGGYSNLGKDIIFIVVSKREETSLIRLVHTVDPSAFIVITTVHDVFGNGFKPIDIE